jgi:hypothetical protein
MSSMSRYTQALGQPKWQVSQSLDSVFNWEYEDGRKRLLNLYDQGKRRQWDAAERIDWSTDLDPENPSGLPDEMIAIYGSDIWNRMTGKERANLRRHLQAWQISQFLHGEQGALICASKIVQQVPDLDAKFYAATQVVDEARHVEAYARLLHEKFELVYPINPNLKALLEDTLTDSRWDFTYLGMQVLIEGVALAAFGLIRDHARNPLAKAVTSYVMEDEARHVTFGHLTLREYYPHLTAKERDEREEFVVEGSYLLRDRFLGDEVWETLGLPVTECKAWTDRSELMQIYRNGLFQRVVPIIKSIGLWGPRVQKAYADMGVLGFADADIDELSRSDERIAAQFERSEREIRRVAGAAAATNQS